ncbi:MAG: TRAP transporter small permease subunit [Oscillospiraceae bacterium]
MTRSLSNTPGALVVGFTGITLVAVIARYVLDSSIRWSEQLCRYLFIWMLMLYFPIIVRHEQNLGFDVLVKRLPRSFRIWLICNMPICAFGGFDFAYTVQLCQKFNAAHKYLDGIHLACLLYVLLSGGRRGAARALLARGRYQSVYQNNSLE